jgi:hypothetical protein
MFTNQTVLTTNRGNRLEVSKIELLFSLPLIFPPAQRSIIKGKFVLYTFGTRVLRKSLGLQ